VTNPEFEQSIRTLMDISAAVNDAIYALHTLPVMQKERDEWKRKYDELLTDSIRTSEQTAMGMLQLVLHPKGGNQ